MSWQEASLQTPPAISNLHIVFNGSSRLAIEAFRNVCRSEKRKESRVECELERESMLDISTISTCRDARRGICEDIRLDIGCERSKGKLEKSEV